MPRVRVSQRAAQRELREKMRDRGMSHRQIASEFARRYQYRSRAAWRYAHGWSLTEAAEQINAYAIKAGLGHGLTTVAMTAAHLCGMEGWPGDDADGRPSGRRPTPYLLSLLAAVYGCTPSDLLDTADCQHLRAADRIILDNAIPTGAPGVTENTAAARMPQVPEGEDPRPSAVLNGAGDPPFPDREDRGRTASLEIAEAGPVTAGGTGRRELVGLAAAAVLAAIGSSLARSHLVDTTYEERLEPSGLIPADADRDQARTASELNDLLSAAKADYQACHYRALAASLPGLLSDAESFSVCASGDEKRRGDALLAAACHVAASLLLKLGDQSLAWVMADRSMRAAEASEDLLAAGSSTRILTHVLFATGRGEDAVRLATATASRLNGRIARSGPASLSVYGSLLLRGAVAAASIDNRSAALELLEEAGEAARRLGADGNYYWTAFGPMNLQLHKVHIAARLGDAGTAIAYAAAINPEGIKMPERKASFWIDVAQARLQRRQQHQVLAALMAAEESAPEEVRNRPAVRGLIADLRSFPGTVPGLDSFAARLGTDLS